MSSSKEILRNLLQSIAENLKYKESEIDITPTKSCGANYTSDLFRAKIIPKNGEALNLFAKVGILKGTFRVQLQGDRIFEIERLFYSDLRLKYDELQEDHKVPEGEKLIFPKFYGCNAKYSEETIVLEDLLEAGYQMHDRRKPIDWHYGQAAVDGLAKFHSLSFAYKHCCSDDYKKNVPKLEMVLTEAYREFRNCWKKMVVKTFSTVDENKRARLNTFLEDFIKEETIMKYFGTGKRGQIVHGDYRPSNLLYKIENGVPSSIIPIDYQTLRLGSPATDFLYFIYSATDKEFRTKHLKKLTDHYYESLAKYLRYYGLNPSTTYSRSDFDSDYKEMLPYGLSQAIFILPIVMVDEKDAPKVWGEDANLANFSVNINEEFNVRFNDIVDEFIEMGVI